DAEAEGSGEEDTLSEGTGGTERSRPGSGVAPRPATGGPRRVHPSARIPGGEGRSHAHDLPSLLRPEHDHGGCGRVPSGERTRGEGPHRGAADRRSDPARPHARRGAGAATGPGRSRIPRPRRPPPRGGRAGSARARAEPRPPPPAAPARIPLDASARAAGILPGLYT